MSKAPEGTIRGRSIEIVDGDGKVRVRIGPDRTPHGTSEDFYNVELRDRDGNEIVRLRASSDGFGMVEVGDPLGPRIHFSADPTYTPGHSTFEMTGGTRSKMAMYRISAVDGRLPRIEPGRHAVEFGDRPTSAAEFEAALPAARDEIAWLEGCGKVGRGTATRGRRHVREMCAELGVPVPDWALPLKRERRRAPAGRVAPS